MRFAFVLTTLAGLVGSTGLATACPVESAVLAEDVSTNAAPTTSAPCLTNVDWRSVRRLFEARYAIGASGTTRTGVGSMTSAFAALELGFALQLGSDPAQPSYEIELSGGASAQRFTGAVEATGLTTRAGLRLGPARMVASMDDEGRGNIAAFPLTMELAHSGELAARPRISSRPEMARALYSRERVELATRVIRVEGAGTKAATTAPGTTEPRKPSAWAIDVFPLHAGVDFAAQDATRFDTTIGGSMLGVVEHTLGAKLDLLALDYHRSDLSMAEPTELTTIWMLRIDGVDPHTGTGYRMGWGEVVVPEQHAAFAQRVDPENGRLSIGGVGWYSRPRGWGGFGMQYRREPYVSMTGELGLEDRVSAEVYFPRALGLVARTFGARTKRLVDDALVHDVTAGIEVDATYQGDGWSSRLGVELGRTYYTVLDDAMPETAGFVGAVGLTLQHTGRRAWSR